MTQHLSLSPSLPLSLSFCGCLSVCPCVYLQMGLLLDLSPDGGMDDEGNDEDLEAELLNLIGGGGGRPQGKKAEGKGEKETMSLLVSLGFLQGRISFIV